MKKIDKIFNSQKTCKPLFLIAMIIGVVFIAMGIAEAVNIAGNPDIMYGVFDLYFPIIMTVVLLVFLLILFIAGKAKKQWIDMLPFYGALLLVCFLTPDAHFVLYINSDFDWSSLVDCSYLVISCFYILSIAYAVILTFEYFSSFKKKCVLFHIQELILILLAALTVILAVIYCELDESCLFTVIKRCLVISFMGLILNQRMLMMQNDMRKTMPDKILLDTFVGEMIKIREANIYYHKNPDGDAVGSAHALALGLQSLGIKCRLFCVDQVPPRYRTLTEKVSQDDTRNPALIAVDSASPERLGEYGSLQFDFCIDHHENNSIPARNKYVDVKSSSCAEIIYRILKVLGVKVTYQIADLLYAGLITDTNCFRSESTNWKTLRTGAELAEYGADISLGKKFCLLKSPVRLRIERILMNNFHYTCNGRVLGCYYTYDDLQQAKTSDAELEGLNGVVDQVAEIWIGIVVRETCPGECRISVRAAESYNAAEICAAFGGNGHKDRAGGRMAGNPADVLAQVEEVCERYILNQE